MWQLPAPSSYLVALGPDLFPPSRNPTSMNRILRLASAALLLGSVAPAHAQHPAVRVGQSVNGTLDGLDPLPATLGRFEVFQFEGRAGERITATARSDSLNSAPDG